MVGDLKIFDKFGSSLEFQIDSLGNASCTCFFDPISVGLIESYNLFFFNKYLSSTLNQEVWLRPLAQQGSSLKFNFSWETSEEKQLFLYQIDSDENIVITDTLQIDCSDGPYWNGQDSTTGLLITNGVPPTFMQLNVGFLTEIEEAVDRTLVITYEIEGEIFNWAKITFHAESEDEDERFRLNIENFKAQLNLTYSDYDIFRESDIEEPRPDWSILNKKRKELILSGDKIIPYIGSYKGLIGVIDFFGYRDLKIKEYWVNKDQTSPNYKKFYLVTIRENEQLNTNNISLPADRFKKTGFFSLYYGLNKIVDNSFDDAGNPTVEDVDVFSPEEVIIKLFALKKKLKDEFLPLNAKIKDITGEGIYFESFSMVFWESLLQERITNKNLSVDFSIETRSGKSINNSNFEQAWLEDLRQIGTIWENFPSFVITQNYSTNTIVKYNGSLYISKHFILAGNFNISDWELLDGINSLRAITASNSVTGMIPVGSFINQLVAYFNDIRGDENPLFEWVDSPSAICGCPVILHADLGDLTWEDAVVSWDDLYPDFSSGVDFSTSIIYGIGDIVRYQGRNWKATASTGPGAFNSSNWIEIYSGAWTWDSVDASEYVEMAWHIELSERNFDYYIRGRTTPLIDTNENIIEDTLIDFPISLPYSGNYNITLEAWDSTAAKVFRKKTKALVVNMKAANFVTFDYQIDSNGTWDDDLTWNNGSILALPSHDVTTWDDADMWWDSTNFTRYLNDQPTLLYSNFGLDVHRWDNIGFNDWDELDSLTWGMLEWSPDSIGGFTLEIATEINDPYGGIIPLSDPWGAFNDFAHTIGLGRTTYNVPNTFTNYYQLSEWLTSIIDEDFQKFFWQAKPSFMPTRIEAVSKFPGATGYYATWEDYGPEFSNLGIDTQKIILNGPMWSHDPVEILWDDAKFSWNSSEFKNWDAELTDMNSLPHSVLEPSNFLFPPPSIFIKPFQVNTLVPIFFVTDNCNITGKKDVLWRITDSETGVELISFNHDYLIWTFMSEGIYSVALTITDNNNNVTTTTKNGWITVKTASKVRPYIRAIRKTLSVSEVAKTGGIEYQYIVVDPANQTTDDFIVL